MSNLYTKVSETLEDLLRQRPHNVQPSPSGTVPLFLILDAKPDVVAFGGLNGDPQHNVQAAIQNFKNLYAVRSTEWANYDLTLILCNMGEQPISYEIRNRIEVDPFFCRKFVIDVKQNLRAEISQLPFVPLEPPIIVDLHRPPSAQTLLKHYGVPAILGRYLAVPHAKGVQAIAEDCIKGLLGEPDLREAQVTTTVEPEEKQKSIIRLKEIEVENFRAYRSKCSFNLDADLVVLYGPNGLGKTSLFDAIDFACTGSVGRFDERFGRRKEKLPKLLQHLDTQNDEAVVSATVSVDGNDTSLSRYVRNSSYASVNGKREDRTATLLRFTNLSKESSDLRIENLVRLFRASHIFGQDVQSLTPENFKKESVLPQDTVSRMLAFQDYVEAIIKSRKVSDALKRQIQENSAELRNMRKALKEKQSERKRLARSVKTVKSPEVLMAAIKGIKVKLHKALEINIDIPEQVSEDVVRDWRALLTAKIETATKQLTRVKELENRLPSYNEQLKHAKNNRHKLERLNEAQGQLQDGYDRKTEQLAVLKERADELRSAEESLSVGKRNLRWLLRQRVEYEGARKELDALSKRNKDTRAGLEKFRPKIDSLTSSKESVKHSVDAVLAEIQGERENLSKLDAFEAQLDVWLKMLEERDNLAKITRDLSAILKTKRASLSTTGERLRPAISKFEEAKRSVEYLKQSQSEFHVLVAGIEKYVSGQLCPVCGTKHESRKVLLEKMKLHQSRQTPELRRNLQVLQEAKKDAERLENESKAIEFSIRQQQVDIEAKQARLGEVEQSLRAVEKNARSIGITGEINSIASVIGKKKNELALKSREHERQIVELMTKLKRQDEQLGPLLVKQETLKRERARLETGEERLSMKLEVMLQEVLESLRERASQINWQMLTLLRSSCRRKSPEIELIWKL